MGKGGKRGGGGRKEEGGSSPNFKALPGLLIRHGHLRYQALCEVTQVTIYDCIFGSLSIMFDNFRCKSRVRAHT